MEQVIPCTLKGEDRQGSQGRPPKRHIDLPEDLEEGGSIDTSGIHQVARDGEEILAEQERPEGAAPEGGQPERNARPDQMQILEDDEVRDESHLRWDQQG